MSIFDITNGFIQTIKSSYNVTSVSYKFVVNTKVIHYWVYYKFLWNRCYSNMFRLVHFFGIWTYFCRYPMLLNKTEKAFGLKGCAMMDIFYRQMNILKFYCLWLHDDSSMKLICAFNITNFTTIFFQIVCNFTFLSKLISKKIIRQILYIGTLVS